GDRDRRGIAGQDRCRRQPVELAEDLELGLGLFARSFDHQLGVLHGVETGRRPDAGQRGVALLGGDRPLLDLPLEVGADGAPHAARSVQTCEPARYAIAGWGKTYPLTGASKPRASVAFQPKCAPHASGIAPGEKKAHASHTPASATLTVENAVALGLPRCASPKPMAPSDVAGPAPRASARRRRG